ncbi:MAG: LTA synthase family protein [Anaerovoracaceae bacterium]
MSDFRSIIKKCLWNSLALCAALAFILNLAIESMARQGIVQGFKFLTESPLVFMYNVLIIFATLSIASLFKRRVFFLTMASGIWLALGVINGVILTNRMTPFTTYDIASLKDGLSIATTYFKKSEITMGIIGIVLLVIGIVVLWKKAPKKKDKVNYRRNIAVVILIVIGTFAVSGLAIEAKVVDTFFPNLAYGYRDNGVPYCFINTWLNTGVAKDKDYTEKNVKSIFTDQELKENVALGTNKGGKKPNILFLQLESLMDPLTIKDMEFSRDPIPNLRKMYGKFPSGKLTVPSVGAGTANTEFEMMTGMSVKFFGPGEYPYKSVLTETTCESIPYNLKELGYGTHAIHNHRGVFYERNLVFPNLGYDTFTSLEYMNNVTTTPKNWAKDGVLVKQIKDAMESTKNQQDYIYTISVQGHGKYPTEEVIENPDVRVTKSPDEETKWSFEYYVNQIYEMDKFVGELTKELKDYGEDVVLVMYGDHLPALDRLTDDTLKGGRNTYQTDYVIWSNFNYGGKDEDLPAYQVGAKVLDDLGIHNGTITTHHQNHRDSKDYLKNLKMLQYDMLYGKKYIYDGKSPFKPVDMKMGVSEIKVNSIVQIGPKYYIKGENFTPYSKVNLDGKILKTFYLGPTVLGLSEKVDPKDAKLMKVSQVESKSEILSTTE